MVQSQVCCDPVHRSNRRSGGPVKSHGRLASRPQSVPAGQNSLGLIAPSRPAASEPSLSIEST